MKPFSVTETDHLYSVSYSLVSEKLPPGVLELGIQTLKDNEQSYKRGSLFLLVKMPAAICQSHCTDLQRMRDLPHF
jgi:hypothetical protein